MEWILIKDKKPPAGRKLLFTDGSIFWIATPRVPHEDMNGVVAWMEVPPLMKSYNVLFRIPVDALSEKHAVEVAAREANERGLSNDYVWDIEYVSAKIWE